MNTSQRLRIPRASVYDEMASFDRLVDLFAAVSACNIPIPLVASVTVVRSCRGSRRTPRGSSGNCLGVCEDSHASVAGAAGYSRQELPHIDECTLSSVRKKLAEPAVEAGELLGRFAYGPRTSAFHTRMTGNTFCLVS